MSNDIVWVEPTKGTAAKHTREARVSLTEIKGRQYTDVVFYDGSQLKITHEDYVSVGLTPARMYFKEVATGMKGFKLSTQGKSKRIRIRRQLTQFVGDRNLYFDAESKLWYIGLN